VDGQRKTPYNSTYPKGGVSSLLDSFVVTESSVLRINICAENSARTQSPQPMPPMLKRHTTQQDND